MELLTEFEIDGAQISKSNDFSIGDVGKIQILKIIGMGELNAQAGDRKFILQPNGVGNGYRSWVHAGGDYGDAEWGPSDGLYLGRNGSFDATFSFEYTLTFIPGAQRVNGFGHSTLAHANNTLIGYRAYGYLNYQNPVRSIQLSVTGGLIRHRTRVYRG